jgi:hypothetical protein
MKKAIIQILETKASNEDTALQILDMFQEFLSKLKKEIEYIPSECIQYSEPKLCNYKQHEGNKCSECLNFSVWDS